MGIGEASGEQGVKKYPSQRITPIGIGRPDGAHATTAVHSVIAVPRDHNGYDRMRRLKPGSKVALLRRGDPDDAHPIDVMVEPNSRLGRLDHPGCRQIALEMLLGTTYEGEVIDVTAQSTGLEILIQVTPLVEEPTDDEE